MDGRLPEPGKDQLVPDAIETESCGMSRLLSVLLKTFCWITRCGTASIIASKLLKRARKWMWSELTQMPRLTSVSSEFLWHDDPQQAVSSHAGGDDFDNHEKRGKSKCLCCWQRE